MSPDSDITILNIKNLKNTASHLQLFFRVQKDADGSVYHLRTLAMAIIPTSLFMDYCFPKLYITFPNY